MDGILTTRMTKTQTRESSGGERLWFDFQRWTHGQTKYIYSHKILIYRKGLNNDRKGIYLRKLNIYF